HAVASDRRSSLFAPARVRSWVVPGVRTGGSYRGSYGGSYLELEFVDGVRSWGSYLDLVPGVRSSVHFRFRFCASVPAFFLAFFLGLFRGSFRGTVLGSRFGAVLGLLGCTARWAPGWAHGWAPCWAPCWAAFCGSSRVRSSASCVPAFSRCGFLPLVP